MKKIKLLTLLFTALLVSGNVWGAVTKVSNVSTLTSAVTNAQDGDTIQLMNTISMGTTQIEITKSITLDLHGRNLYGAPSSSGTNGVIYMNAAGKTLSIINDSTNQGMISCTTSGTNISAIKILEGNLIVNGEGLSNNVINIKSASRQAIFSYDLKNGSNIDMTLNNNTIIESTMSSAGNGIYINHPTNLIIKANVSFACASGNSTFIPIITAYPLELTSYCSVFPKTKIKNSSYAATINNYGTISEGDLVSNSTTAGQANVVTLNNYGDVTFKEIFAHRLTLNNMSGATCSIESGAQFLGTVMNIDNKGTMTITDGFFNANTFSFANTGTFSITGGTMTNEAYDAFKSKLSSSYTTIVYALSASENGKKILTKTEKDNYEYKAEVEGVQYATFETALVAANASANSNLTINLLRPDALSFSKLSISNNISAINLNGHTLSGNCYFDIVSSNNFTVDGGNGVFNTTNQYAFYINHADGVKPTCEFKNLTINRNYNKTNTKGCIELKYASSIILDNVTISLEGSAGGYGISCPQTAHTTDITCKNNISLDYVSSSYSSLRFSGQNAYNIKDFTITFDATAIVTDELTSEQINATLSIVNNGTVSNFAPDTQGKDFSLTNNGTFIFTGGAQRGTVNLSEGAGATTLLRGGNYGVSAHGVYLNKVADGYAWEVVKEDTEWKVVDSSTDVASYNGTIYKSLTAAISAAIADNDPNKAITILTALTLKDKTVINGNVKFDLNGNNISFDNNYFELAGGSLNVVNSGAAAKISNTNGMAIFINNHQANLTVGANVTIEGTSNAIIAQKAGVLSVADATLVSGNDYNDIEVRNYIGNAILSGSQSMEIPLKCRYNAANDATLSAYKVAGSKTIFQRFAPYGEVKCVVVADATPQAAIGSYMYLGMTDAIANVQSGETIVLQTNASNINISGQRDNITDSTQITVDLNGHTWDVMSGMEINDGSLNIIGTGTVTTSKVGYNLFIVRGASTDVADYSMLSVGQNVTLVSASGCYAVSVYGQTDYATAVYGAVVNFDGTINGKSGSNTCNGLYVNGNNQTADINSVQMNIGSHAVITVPNYAAGYAKWTIADGASISASIFALEIRAGELTINGGSYTGTYNTISCNPNGNGSTTTGAAIAIAQHTTKQPIIVTINGGEFRAPMAMIQVNPQNNTEADYKQMIVNVNGGRFWSSNNEAGTLFENQESYGKVTYAADAMFISQNRRIFLRGGYYNYDPVNFVAAGYQSIKLADIPEAQRTADDIAAMAANYVYKIGDIKPEEAKTTQIGTNWVTDSTTLWSDKKVPTTATPVIIDKAIIVTTPANAYSIHLDSVGSGGTAKLTVKDGGMLMVGAGGVSGATKVNFVVEDGGMLCIAPNAEEFEHPDGTVIISSDYARRKDAAADAKVVGELTTDDLYWKHVACPTINADRELTLSKEKKTYISTWNLKNGWESKSAADWKTPFVGYSLSTILQSEPSGLGDSVFYTFKGQLAGNKVDPLKFNNSGFTFFGNSYLAPIDIRELLTSLDVNSDVESSVILYKYEEDWYEYINWAAFALPDTRAEIEPLQGFFVFSEEPASVEYNYTKAVWDAFCSKARIHEGASAPVRRMTNDNMFDAIACVQVASNNGKHDKVYLFEGEQFSDAMDKGYDARKMNTGGVQIAAVGATDNLAIIATDNLDGTNLALSTNDATQYTLTFSNINGTEYAIYDVVTGTTVNMTEGATYTFSADANMKQDNRFRVVSSYKMPTDIAESSVSAKAKGIYTILGQYLGEGNMWTSLPKGVYVVNGEKMVR